jgi:hypothetical protein
MTRNTKTSNTKQAWRRWSEGEARAAFAELAETKETAVAFARRKQISTQRLQYWKKRVKSSLPSRTTPAFVAVAMPASSVRGEVEIRVGDIAVVVHEGCDVEEVARLIEALSRRMRAC